MALPWLESLRVWGDDGRATSGSEAPVRVAVLFAGIVVAINLFVDLAYAWANPKVRT